jgi:hypothetical protein
MADITNEYAVDPLTGESIAVDPPLQQSDAPLMGNPILTRRSVPRKRQSSTALYAGAAIAVVAVLAGSAYLIASNHQRSDLMTSPATTPPAQQQAAATPAPTPMEAPVSASKPPTARIVARADVSEPPARVARAERADVTPVRHAARHQAARSADENSADASVTVSPSQAVSPSTAVTPQAAPAVAPAPTATPAPAAPEPAPVITPPAPQ